MLHLTIRTNQFELGSEQDNVSRKEEGIFFFFSFFLAARGSYIKSNQIGTQWAQAAQASQETRN